MQTKIQEISQRFWGQMRCIWRDQLDVRASRLHELWVKRFWIHGMIKNYGEVVQYFCVIYILHAIIVLLWDSIIYGMN